VEPILNWLIKLYKTSVEKTL